MNQERLSLVRLALLLTEKTNEEGKEKSPAS